MINEKVLEYKKLLKIYDYKNINKKLFASIDKEFGYIDIIMSCVLYEIGFLDMVCTKFICENVNKKFIDYKLIEIKDKDLSFFLVDIVIGLYFDLFRIDDNFFNVLNSLFLNSIFTKFTINFYLIKLIHIKLKLSYAHNWLWDENVFNSIGLIDVDYDDLFKIIESLLKERRVCV